MKYNSLKIAYQETVIQVIVFHTKTQCYKFTLPGLSPVSTTIYEKLLTIALGVEYAFVCGGIIGGNIGLPYKL